MPQSFNARHSSTRMENGSAFGDSSLMLLALLGACPYVPQSRVLVSSFCLLPIPPPLPHHSPRRHQFLHSARFRQPISLHPARLIRLTVGVRHVVGAEQRKAALAFRQFLRGERLVAFFGSGAAGHNGDSIAGFAFPSPALWIVARGFQKMKSRLGGDDIRRRVVRQMCGWARSPDQVPASLR